MNKIKKFITSLNAAHVALGITLGIAAGLLSQSVLLLVLILTPIIYLRANLIAFISSFAIFYFAAPLIDLLTHGLGAFLLSSESLKSFWTMCYNAPVIPWTGFNNTVTLGSLILCLILAAPLTMALKTLILRLKKNIADCQILENNTINDKVNVSLLIKTVIFVVLILGFFYFAFDPLLKIAAVKGLQAATGAKVDISELHTKFLNPAFIVKGFAAADSKQEFKNAVEFSELHFTASGTQLLKKKIIIDDASLKGLRFGTDRKTSGKIAAVNKTEDNEKISEFSKKMKDKASSYLSSAADSAKSDLKSKYQVNADDLETVKLAKKLEAEYKQSLEKIKESLNSEKYEKEIEVIKQKNEAAKKEKNTVKQVLAYKAIAEDIKKLSSGFEADKKLVKTSLASLKTSLKSLDEARKKDIAAALNKMNIGSFDSKTIADLLVGPVLADKTSLVMEWIALAKKYMAASDDEGVVKDKSLPRGENIIFPVINQLPSLLIQHMSLSGELGLENPMAYAGKLENLSSDPKNYGKPVVLSLKGEDKNRKFNLDSSLKVIKDKVTTSSMMNYSGMEIKDMNLGNENSLLVKIENANGNFNGNLKTEGPALSGIVNLQISGASITSMTKGLTGIARTAAENAFKGVKTANIGAAISGDFPAPDLDIKTDLAKRLSEGLAKAVGEEVKKAQGEIEKQINDAIKPYTDKLNSVSSSGEGEINGKLNGIQSLIEKQNPAASGNSSGKKSGINLKSLFK